jgi:hypothetical protein
MSGTTLSGGFAMVRNFVRHAAHVPALAIGVLVGAVLLSGVAVAAAPGLVTIADPTGTNKASVNGAGQLLAAESNPRNLVTVFGSISTTCTMFYTVPAGKALIIKSVTFDQNANDAVGLYTVNCAGIPIAISRQETTSTENQQLGAGVAVATGKKLAGQSFGTSAAGILVYGYLVPAALVP